MQGLDQLLSEHLHLIPSHVEKFKELMVVKKYRKKDMLISEGTVCDFLGVVLHGSLRSYMLKDGVDYNNDFYFENDFVSAYNSFLSRQTNFLNIQALSEAEVCCLSYRQMEDLVKEDPEWYKLGKHVSDQLFIKKCNRESSFLKDSAAERYESCLRHYPGIEQKVSQYHIASYLGVKPETLSRIRRATQGKD
jgi:CRP-like cAMP-binding protein